MKQVNLELDNGPRVTLLNDGDQLLFAPRKRAPWSEAPRLHGGMTAHHLSIPLKPRLHGEHAGKFWIHLKYPDGKHEHIAALDPDAFGRAFKALEEDMVRLFLEQTLWELTPEDLAEFGSVVCVPKASLSTIFDQFFTNPRRTYALTNMTFEGLVDHVEMASPLVLLEDRFRDLRCTISTHAEYPGVQMSLNRDPGANTWAMTPCPFISDDELIELIGRHFPGIWGALYVIGRELQMPMDREKLARLMSAPLQPD